MKDIRLALTIIDGALIGLNREARGHAAGFRTKVLVALPASVAMIETNILLPIGGRDAGSFAVMNLMRLPLGILTGVGFIGGGAILKRGDLIVGVTTAATLWVVTEIGLCFGGGQLGLGCAATAISAIALRTLKWCDDRILREHRAKLTISAEGEQTCSLSEVGSVIGQSGFKRFVGQRRYVGSNATYL